MIDIKPGFDDALSLLAKTLLLATLVYFSGYLFGLGMFLGCMWIHDLVLYKYFGLQRLAVMDYLFLYDNPRARSNIVGKLSISVSKFEL